jgi:Predicted transcriptional regulators
MRPNRTDLMQGTLELLILKTLSRKSLHGYGIAQQIHQAVDDLLKWKTVHSIPRFIAWKSVAGLVLSGEIREQPARQVLQAHKGGSEAARNSIRELGAGVSSNGQSPGSNLRGVS